MELAPPARVVMEGEAPPDAVLDREALLDAAAFDGEEALTAGSLLAADELAAEAVAWAVLPVFVDLVRKRLPERVRRAELVVPAEVPAPAAEEAVTAAAEDSGASELAAASPDAVAVGILVVTAPPRSLPASVMDSAAVRVFLVRVPFALSVTFKDSATVAEVPFAVTVRVFFVQLVLELPSAPGTATGGCAPPPPPAAGPPTTEPPSGKDRVALAAAANPRRKESVICIAIAEGSSQEENAG